MGDDTKSDVMDDRRVLPLHYIIDYTSILKRSDDSMGTLPLIQAVIPETLSRPYIPEMGHELMQKSDSIATEDCSDITGFTNLDNTMNQIDQQLKAWKTFQTIAKNEE